MSPARPRGRPSWIRSMPPWPGWRDWSIFRRKRNALWRSARSQPREQVGLFGTEIVAGIVPGDHLARVEQSLRIGLLLECELHLVGLLHTAFFQGVAVRIEGERAHVLVHAVELVEPFLAGEAHQRYAEASDL